MSAATYLRSREIESDPVAEPVVVRRPQSRARAAQPRRQISRTLMGHIVMMVVVSCITWFLMILLGNSMMENARREHIRAQSRANAARQDVARLHRRAERLASMAAIDEWARAKGYVPPAIDPKEWVAANGTQETQ